ncbi:MAG: hypothetical protein E6Q97_13625 [Desulfurellales bacterium]|nr:MAG: hypothetical protein E6Q97_13625 [Desulfurellales bacterium]
MPTSSRTASATRSGSKSKSKSTGDRTRKPSSSPRSANRQRQSSAASNSEVDHFAAFCREHLVQSIDTWDGEPLELEQWETDLLTEALAYDDEGWPIWNSIVIQVSRKNGKTTLLAGYAVYRLLTSDGSPEILLAAASDKQAGRLYDAAAAFIRRSKTLSGLCRIRDYVGEIVREDGEGRIMRMSSDPSRLHGYNPSLVVCDELAQWTTPTLKKAYAALTSGGGARRAPQTFTITTAGEAIQRHSSILGRILDAAEGSEDVDREPGLMVARMSDAKTLVWAYEAPTDDPHDTAAMKLANPASWITEEYLKRQAANPELSDADVLQLHGCVWAESETNWIPGEAWAGAEDAEREVPDGSELVLGFDGSYSRDSTALIASTPDGHVFPIKVWERPEKAPDDWRIPRHEVDAAVDRAMERYRVTELACDPPGWGPEIAEWADRYGEHVVTYFETNKGAVMAPATDRFRTAVYEGELTHNGDPTLRRHIANCATKETANGTMLTKTDDRNQKIDAAVAAVIAYERATAGDGHSVYEDRGLVVL